jgi:calcium-dependent protein kinase
MDIASFYDFGAEIGRGAHGVVRVVVCRKTGHEAACKSIAKLATFNIGDVHREVAILRRMGGSRHVAKLEDVFEDMETVHIVTELCRGGEVRHSAAHNERTTAARIRTVLQLLVDCHANSVLHRDIKPGNFVLLFDSPDSPIKAVDFGLAVNYDPDAPLAISNLSMEGTPWFMAPETMSSRWGPEADVWAAGVMAHQLLTGCFPFDDKQHPRSPRLHSVLRSILVDKLDLTSSHWNATSSEARDFVMQALQRDPRLRPSAKSLLGHPWLR